MKRSTRNDIEIAKTSLPLIDGTVGRIERLMFADAHQEGLCFSWWDNDRIMPRPLDGTNEEMLLLFKGALHNSVFSADFSAALKEMLSTKSHGEDGLTLRLRNTSYAKELGRVSIALADGHEARIEKLLFKQDVYAGKEGIRFSWWRGNRMMPWPLSLTEQEMLCLLEKALQRELITEVWCVALRDALKSTLQ